MGRIRFKPTFLCYAILIASGCGSSDQPAPAVQTPAPPAAVSEKAQPDTSSVVAKADEPAASATDAAATPPANASTQGQTQAQRPVTPTAPAPIAPPAAPPAAPPTTARAAQAVLNLEAFLTPTVKQAFEWNPSSISYSTEGTLTGANSSVMKELGKAGWKEAKHLVTSTDQYVDRLLEKDNYYLRLTISTGGIANEVMVNMSLLGNFDVRTLPQAKDAEPQESTAVMAGHRSSLSIAAAYEDLSKRMVEAGWQIMQDYQNTMPEVPHYRSIRFRKNAVRVNLGFATDPAKPSDKTNIFYHAESVLPLDVPTIDSKQAIKFDAIENRVMIPFRLDRPAMVELLAQNAKSFGWQLVGADDFVNEKSSVMYLSLGTPVGVAARLVETGGNYWISMNRAKLPVKQDAKAATEQANSVAQAETPAESPAAKKMKAEIEAEIAATGNAIDKAINDELTKALGSLSGDGKKPDMQALQAQAAKLQAQLSKADEEGAEKTPPRKSATSVVPDDVEPIKEEDRNISTSQASIQFGDRQIVLKHCLAYAVMENDTPTKILFFSDKPLKADKLDKLRDSGERFSISDGYGDSYPDVSLELRLTENGSVLSFSGDGVSISTNSSDIRSTVRLKNGKLQGRATLQKPMEIRKGNITFEVTVAESVRR